MGQYYHPCLIDSDGNPTAWCTPRDFGSGVKLMEHAYLGDSFVMAVESMLYDPARLVWLGDYGDDDLNSKLTDGLKAKPTTPERQARYIINEDTGFFVERPQAQARDFCIDPLPLLTSMGNGLGGGDYRGTLERFVGSWSGCFIRVSFEHPGDEYAQVTFNFKEGR